MFQTRCWAKAAAAFVSIGWVGVSAAATLNVPGDFATIQACIDAAVSGVDECVVAPGTYHETINFLGKAITVRSSGGADVTTIDATGIGGSVVTCASGEGQDTVLDSFTITGGTGTADPYGFTYGGGMFNDHSSPTVSNCTFTGNTTRYFGGGIYNSSSSPTVSNCTFGGNTVTNGSGGGMYNEKSSNPTVTDCTFSGNRAYSGGGMLNDHSSPEVTNCAFSGNTGTGEGGGMYNDSSNPTVTSCTFSGNTARYFGGGMYNNYNSSPTVSNCTFSGNTARYFGGGIYNSSSSPTVTNCTFSGNTTSNEGGGMYNYNFSNPTVTNCTFSGNTGYYGGGMYNRGNSSPTVTNCTFSGNTAYYGGGMYNRENSSPAVSGCTFSENTGTADGGGMYNRENSSPAVTNCIFWRDNPQEILNRYGSAPTLRFSDVQGGLPLGAVDGGGNINVDPMFVRVPDPGPDGTWDGVDDDYGDLRLQAGSPCIDAGDPGFLVPPGETDLDGHARVLCGQVDMGAYEFGIGDYDCNQTVNLSDFSAWSSCMAGPHSGPYEPGCEALDFDGDGDVDLLDFGGFQRIVGP